MCPSPPCKATALDRERRRHRTRPEPSQDRQPPSSPAQPVQGEVHRYPADPLLGPGIVTHLRPADRRSGEGLLDDILGVAEVTGDQIHLAYQTTKGTLVELVEPIIRRHAYLTFDGPHRFAQRGKRLCRPPRSLRGRVAVRVAGHQPSPDALAGAGWTRPLSSTDSTQA